MIDYKKTGLKLLGLLAVCLAVLLSIGLGSVAFALGILFTILFIWAAFKWVPMLFKGCVNLFRKIFSKRKGGNEV